ncbi:uncharacterized protein LOC114363977 [Ostrinia furnacalis]|uniref:uncharacterized protein LOC114363977 n=1 Tax=Ostrinia furnacalis TaxID=93504 RepID=UPI00103BFACF|nr:uncharacterized protein LOC114363977 [Ostrinia furnacalis]
MSIHYNILCSVLVIAFVVLCNADYAHECIYDDSGLCIEDCPPGTISYTSGCGTEETMSQRTCRRPIARSIGFICDLSRCDCPEPKVWDETIEKCVFYKDCSSKNFSGRNRL